MEGKKGNFTETTVMHFQEVTFIIRLKLFSQCPMKFVS